MDHLCSCGDELVISTSDRKQTSYCQSCGREEQITLAPKPLTPVIPLSRASILKKLNNKPQEEQKKPKQLRDRTDYTKARRAR